MDDDECGVWGCMDEHEFTLYQVWKWKWKWEKAKYYMARIGGTCDVNVVTLISSSLSFNKILVVHMTSMVTLISSGLSFNKILSTLS